MVVRFGNNPRVRIERIETLSDAWYVLRKVVFSWRRSDGSWQRQEREAYDRGDGAAALLFRRAAGTVILTRQFRAPAYLNGHEGMLIEAAAGLLDAADPETAIRKEIEEPIIALVSLGERRRFLLRPHGGGSSSAFSLGRGDLLVAGGRTNRDWEHSVPKVSRAGPRISLAFRHGMDVGVYSDDEAES